MPDVSEGKRGARERAPRRKRDRRNRETSESVDADVDERLGSICPPLCPQSLLHLND